MTQELIKVKNQYQKKRKRINLQELKNRVMN